MELDPFTKIVFSKKKRPPSIVHGIEDAGVFKDLSAFLASRKQKKPFLERFTAQKGCIAFLLALNRPDEIALGNDTLQGIHTIVFTGISPKEKAIHM